MEALNKVDPIKRSPDAFVLIQVVFTTHGLYNTPVSLLHARFRFTTGCFLVYHRPVFRLLQAGFRFTTGQFARPVYDSHLEEVDIVDPIKRSPDAFVLIQVIFTTHPLFGFFYSTPLVQIVFTTPPLFRLF